MRTFRFLKKNSHILIVLSQSNVTIWTSHTITQDSPYFLNGPQEFSVDKIELNSSIEFSSGKIVLVLVSPLPFLMIFNDNKMGHNFIE